MCLLYLLLSRRNHEPVVYHDFNGHPFIGGRFDASDHLAKASFPYYLFHQVGGR